MVCFFNHPVVAKDQKDIPEWMKSGHQWEPGVDVNKLKKYQLEVKMCCSKCAEKVKEEIREVNGVFDVRVERMENKVIVVEEPSGFDEHEVLLKARKIHKKAKFVDLDQNERPKKDEGKKELQAKPSESKCDMVPVNCSDYLYWPISSIAPLYHYGPNQILRYPNPHGQCVQFL